MLIYYTAHKRAREIPGEKVTEGQPWFYVGVGGNWPQKLALAHKYFGFTHQHMAAKRSVLWPSKYSKMFSAAGSGSSRRSPKPSSWLGRGHPTLPHSAPRFSGLRRSPLGASPNIFLYNRPHLQRGMCSWKCPTLLLRVSK